jgi:hypothetical protein
MFSISSLTDIVAIGGFNPNKYMTPQPMFFNPSFHMTPQFQYGMTAPFNHHPNMAPQFSGDQNKLQKNWKKDKKDKKEKNIDKKFVKKDSPQKQEKSATPLVEEAK